MIGSHRVEAGNSGSFLAEFIWTCFELTLCRLVAVTGLFRIILDTTSPDFNVEGRQWRSSIVDVFYYYFGSLWTDDRVRSIFTRIRWR